MDILTRDRIVDSNTLRHVVPGGLTIDEIMASVSWDHAVRDWTMVTLNGHEILPENWRRVRPREGSQLMIAVRPFGRGGSGGGGSGKQILTAIATVAIVVAAWYAAPFIASAFAGGSLFTAATISAGTQAMIAGGLSMVGTLALGALVKPASLAKVSAQNTSVANAPTESKTYGVTGSQNSANRYGVVPRIYGRHRFTPNHAAEPYVVSAGPAQTVYMLLDFGYGPIRVEDLKIGNTSIGSFPSAEWRIHEYYRAGDNLEIYKNDQASATVNSVLAQDVDNIRTVPQSASVINLDISFSGGLIEFDDRGRALERVELLNIFASPASNPTQWFPINWYFNPYAIFESQGSVGSSGEKQVAAIWFGFLRERGNAVLTNDPEARNVGIGMRVSYKGQDYRCVGVNSPPTGGAIDNNQFEILLDRQLVDAVFPWKGPPNDPGDRTGYPQGGGVHATFHTTSSGGIFGPLTVSFGPSGADVRFSGLTRAPRTVSIILQMPNEDNWNILVRRMTPISTNTLVANAMTWSTIRASRWVLPILPKAARTIMELRVTGTEQISGQVENVNALCTSLLWDPRQQRMVESRNPALVYMDILAGAANPRPVPWHRIDQDRILAWADMCESASPQGDPRFTLDMVVDFRSTIYELLQTVTSAGRAAPTMRDGLYSILRDDEDTQPVQLFSNRNANSVQSTRTWIELPHAVKVRFMSENTWQREELIAYMDGYGPLTATKFESLDLVGIVRPWQAWRAARYFMAAAVLRREKMSFTTDVENLICQRGDHVLFAHDRLLGNAVGRVREIQGGLISTDIDINAQTFSVKATPTFPADDINTSTGLPRQWWIADADVSMLTVTVTGTGVDPISGEGYADFRVTRPPNSGAVHTVIRFDYGLRSLNVSDDSLRHFSYARITSVHPIPANGFLDFIVSRFGPSWDYGDGWVRLPGIPLVLDTQDMIEYTTTQPPGGDIALTNGIAQSMIFRWENVDFSLPIDFTIRLTSGFLRTINPKPDLLQRVHSAGTNLIANPEGTGAILGNVVTNGVVGAGRLPTGWAWDTGGFPNWTVDVTQIRRAWSHYEVDVRVRAPIGALNLFVFRWDMDMVSDHSPFGRIQLQRPARVGTRLSTFLRFFGFDSSTGGTTVTLDGAYFHSSPDTPAWFTQAADFTARPDLRRLRFALCVVPNGAAEASDATFRIRMPLVGANDPIANLPAPEVVPTYYAEIRGEDGFMQGPFPVADFPETNQVLLSRAHASQVRPGDVIAIGTLNRTTSEWVVESIRPGADLSASLTLIENAPGMWLADTGDIPEYVPNNGDGWALGLDAIVGISLLSSSLDYTVTGMPRYLNRLVWSPPGYRTEKYVVERLLVPLPGSLTPPLDQDNVRVTIGETNLTTFTDELDTRLLHRSGTRVRYYVIAVTPDGRQSEDAFVEEVMTPDITPPPQVVFTTNVLSETTMLIWVKPDVPDLFYYQIRFTHRTDFGAQDWDQMVVMVERVAPDLTSLTSHAQTGTYAIRAVDTSGNWSVPSYSTTTVSELPNVDEITRLPFYPGTGDNGINVGPDWIELALRPDGFAPEGFFACASSVLYPSDWVFRLRALVETQAWRGALGTEPASFDGYVNAEVYVSVSKDLPVLAAPWFSPLAHAKPLAGGPGSYVPLSVLSHTDVEGRYVTWGIRLTSTHPNANVRVNMAELIVDHAERREFGDDVAIGVGGLRVPFNRSFFYTPTVSVTINNGQPGDTITKSADRLSFTVEIKNNAGQSVSRNIDWAAIGYGKGIV